MIFLKNVIIHLSLQQNPPRVYETIIEMIPGAEYLEDPTLLTGMKQLADMCKRRHIGGRLSKTDSERGIAFEQHLRKVKGV